MSRPNLMTNVQIIIHYIHLFDYGVGGCVCGRGRGECYSLTILVLASCWVKNVTNKSELAPKSHQLACRATTY